MKKNYLLLVIFLVLGAGTAWYLLGKKKGEASTLGWDRKFKVENAADIHKIFIAQRTGETTTLERQGDHWVYNGKWKARPGAMESLLQAITQVQLKFVPAQAAIDGMVRELGARGIKVEIFDKKGEKIKAYYVGGVLGDARGTVMIMEGSEQPYVVELPLMEGQIRTRYDMTGDDWRDRALFSYKPEEITTVSIEYPMQRSKSFRLERDGKDFKVEPFYPATPRIARPVDKSAVEAFLVGFESLIAENYDNQYGKKDSIRQFVPFSIVTVKDARDSVKSAVFYQLIKHDAYGQKLTDIVERYFTEVNNGDWMITQHRVFSKIFWAYEGFFKSSSLKK
jgi:hypothetical protein